MADSLTYFTLKTRQNIQKASSIIDIPHTSKHTHQVWLEDFGCLGFYEKTMGDSLSLSLTGIFWDHRTFSYCTQPWLGIIKNPIHQPEAYGDKIS